MGNLFFWCFFFSELSQKYLLGIYSEEGSKSKEIIIIIIIIIIIKIKKRKEKKYLRDPGIVSEWLKIPIN